MTLDAADIEAVARRIVELMTERPAEPPRNLVDAATLARELGVERDWVYARARQLGAIRLGDGPGARLRFDRARVRAALAPQSSDDQPPPDPPPRRRRAHPPRQAAPAGVRLIQGRAGR